LDVPLEAAFEPRESRSRSALDIHDDTDSCISVKKVNKVRSLADRVPHCRSVCDRAHRSRPLFAGGHPRGADPAMNSSRLEKVRKLKLDVSEKAPAAARRWEFWVLLVILVAGAFLALKNTPLRNSVSATVEASTASAYAAPATSTFAPPTETPGQNRFTAAGYVEPIPPFPREVANLGGREPARRCPLVPRTAGGSHS
jgi:hypothetical protein